MNSVANGRPEAFIVSLIGPAGRAVGCGVLVGSREIVTCAHVVNSALGRDRYDEPMPTGSVTVEFPLLVSAGEPPVRFEAEVRMWRPATGPGEFGSDIAGLVLTVDPTARGARPARMVPTMPMPGMQMRVFGFPGTPARPSGGWVTTLVQGPVRGGRLQLDSDRESALRVQPGYSGAPLCDPVTNRVAGIVVTAAAGTDGPRDSYAITAATLRKAWPEVLDRDSRIHAPPVGPQLNGERRDADRLTVLHLSDTQFGANHMFGGNGGASMDDADTLLERLRIDLSGLAANDGLAPDLIVVTGDLTETGRPSEFARAMAFIAALADAAGVPRRHVAMVPGNHDVNRLACEAHFKLQQAAEEEPVWPYMPKWTYFRKAFDEFYADVDGVSFTPDEPYTLFRMPELRVVVAGINSTMDESHQPERHYGKVTEKQARWFAERLREFQQKGWLRLGAVHHNVVRGAVDDDENLRDAQDLDRIIGADRLVNLLLHGHTHDSGIHRLDSGLVALATGSAAVRPEARPAEVPNQYQLVTLHPDGFVRHARQYALNQRRWIGDNRVSRTGSSWQHDESYPLTDSHATFGAPTPPLEELPTADPPLPTTAGTVPAPRKPVEDGLFAQVVAATRIRYPNAQIEERREYGYLRVTRESDQSRVEMWPIGVLDGPVTERAIRTFIEEVHSQFATNNATTLSELVYAGSPAADILTAAARQRGVRLRSFMEYQGQLDLRALIREQTNRLKAGEDSAPGFYLEQRYRLLDDRKERIRVGLAEDVTGWLSTEGARLIIVLGDFGRGKTSLLRQLARTLPDELPDLQPILVELGSLQRAPTLDGLVSQFLINHQVEDISAAKVGYMVQSGRMTLLFDGFDELEQRVGYASAADYLQRLLDSVTTNSHTKLVLTSRTQHFQSTEQLLTAVGDRVASLPGSRIVLLEDFSPEQIQNYLVRLYEGDEDQAEARFQQLAEREHLLGLAQNPRMLAFIAELDDEMLRTVQEHGTSAAALYRELIRLWLDGTMRREHAAGIRFTPEERRRACMILAQRLWNSGKPGIDLAELADVAQTLKELANTDIRTEEVAHSLGTNSLLVRRDDGTFAFVHQSVLEWLVAEDAAETLAAEGTPTMLTSVQGTDLMIEFLVDLAGVAVASDWADAQLADPVAPDPAKQNALKIRQQIGTTVVAPTEQHLARIDLRGQDLNEQNLRAADLQGAILRDMRLVRVDFSDANLTDADMSGVRFIEGRLDRAVLSGSRWAHSAILGDVGLAGNEDDEALQDAAIPARDGTTVQIAAGGPPTTIAISPEGRFLAIARLNAIEIVDRSNGRPLRVITDHAGAVTAVMFSPDGSRLASAADDGTARVHHLVRNEAPLVFDGHDGSVTAVAFSADGRLLATGSVDLTAKIWEIASGSVRAELRGHSNTVSGVAFSPDGQWLATAGYDGIARIWAVGSWQPVHILTGHTGLLTSVEFSPNSALLATASYDRSARIWRVRDGLLHATLLGHTDSLSAATFDPSGHWVATATFDGAIQLWRVDGRPTTAFSTQAAAVRSLAFSADGLSLLSASDDNAVCTWDVLTGKVRSTITGPTDELTRVAFTPDGSSVVTATAGGPARRWSTTTGRLQSVVSVPANSRAVRTEWSTNATRFAVAGRDHKVLIRTIGSLAGEPPIALSGHTDQIVSITFAPDGQRVATASLDHTVRIWNAGTGRLEAVFGDVGLATAVAFAADTGCVAVAVDDRSIQLWDPGTKTKLMTTARADRHEGFISAVAFSPDGTVLASASYDRTARIWDARTGRCRNVLSGHDHLVTGVAFAPDGKLLATTSYDKTVRIWNTRSGRHHATLFGHTGFVTDAAFSPDGNLLATVALDRTTRLWDVKTRTEYAALIGLRNRDFAVLRPDGSYKLEGDARDGLWWTVKLCRFGPGELDAYVENLRRIDSDTPIINPRPRE